MKKRCLLRAPRIPARETAEFLKLLYVFAMCRALTWLHGLFALFNGALTHSCVLFWFIRWFSLFPSLCSCYLVSVNRENSHKMQGNRRRLGWYLSRTPRDTSSLEGNRHVRNSPWRYGSPCRNNKLRQCHSMKHSLLVGKLNALRVSRRLQSRRARHSFKFWLIVFVTRRRNSRYRRIECKKQFWKVTSIICHS